MRSRKPNLFLIGAMKSGTTFLGKLLGAHPEIYMTDPDEPSYFVDPDQLKKHWRDMWEQGYWRSEASYLRLFDAAGDAKILGEASTNYTKLPLLTGVPGRIAAYNPDARFIYLLRDPIERTISHYWHMVRYHTEHRPIGTAIQTDSHYMDVSYYAMQLRPYLQRFGHDQIMVVTHEQLIRNTGLTMDRLYDWLGLDPAPTDLPPRLAPENVTPPVVPLPRLNAFARHMRQVTPLRRIDGYLSPGIRERMRGLLNRPVSREAVDTTEVVAFLRRIQRRQTEELAALLDRPFPEWTTLYGAQATRLDPMPNGGGEGACLTFPS